MNALLEYIKTPAQAVEAFRKINERVAFFRDKEEGASLVFEIYYPKMEEIGILELLDAVPKLPKDIWSIMTRFLLQLRRTSSQNRAQLIECLLRKIMLIELLPDSITNGASRQFTWNESNQRKRTKNMPAEANPVKSWIGSSYVREIEKTSIDGTSSLITITEFTLPSAGNLKGFAWEISEIKPSGKIYAYGFAESLEESAEKAYRAFYEVATNIAFESARQFAAGKEIILYGTELTSEELLKGAGNKGSFYNIVQMPLTDDREGILFCLNWHTIHKTKRTFKIMKVQGKKVILEGGTTIDVDTVLCYVKNPEQYVNTEVLCTKCKQIGIPIYNMGKYAQGKGYQCGPCINNSLELSELWEGQID